MCAIPVQFQMHDCIDVWIPYSFWCLEKSRECLCANFDDFVSILQAVRLYDFW